MLNHLLCSLSFSAIRVSASSLPLLSDGDFETLRRIPTQKFHSDVHLEVLYSSITNVMEWHDYIGRQVDRNLTTPYRIVVFMEIRFCNNNGIQDNKIQRRSSII